jgi:MFS family permease
MTTLFSALSRSRAAIGLTVVCAAHFLVGADGLAVAIALPSLQHDLQATAIDAQWALTAYGLAFGGVLLLGGRLGDLYGRRRLLVYGMAAFAGGSLLAGLAPGLGLLIAARALQGLGAATAVPAALALISSVYPQGPARTRALSLLAAMATVGIMSGLLFGGVITDLLGWRWVFLLMAPLAAITAAIAPRVLPEARVEERPDRPDVGGAALLCAGLIAVLFGLTRMEHGGIITVLTIVPLLAGTVLLVAFVLWERRASVPLVRFEILRVRSLRVASLAVGANALAFISIVYLGTLYLRDALGYSALQAGLALLPLDAVALVISLFAGNALIRRPPWGVLSGAFALVIASLLWLARAPAPANYLIDLLPPLLVLGAALPSVFIVSTHEAIADVAPDEKGLASGIFETANHLLGGAIGVAVYATVLTSAAGGAGGYRATFLTATVLVTGFALPAVLQAHRNPKSNKSESSQIN